jgi:Ig-like domain CHU_C associated/PKD-like domain
MKKLFYAISLILLFGLIIPSANIRIVSAQSPQLILFWDDSSSTPPGWTCISNNLGDDFFEIFPRGAPSYGGTGGSLTHSHTAGVVSCSPPSVTTQCKAGLLVTCSSSSHTHTSATIVAASNVPLRRGLRIIRCDTGIPSTIPAGAIALFDSEPLPPGWTRYSAQDGYFIEGVSITGMVFGSNTHNHLVSTGGPSSTVNAGIGAVGVATGIHVHTGTSDTQSNEPPYIEIILAKADSDTSIPRSMIGMFNNSPGGCWDVISDIGGVLYHRFVKGSSIYGATGGAESHSHANLTITPPLAQFLVRNTGVGTNIFVGSVVHTHNITVSFSTDSNLPPYRDVIFAKLGTLIAQPSSNSPVCEGSIINLSGGPDGMAIYNWYGPGGWASTDRNPTRTADNTTAGTYYLSVVNNNGCTSDNATVNVIVNPLPAVDAGSDQQTCQSAGPIALTGENPTGGIWSGTGVSGSQFDPDSLLPGAYSVMYTYTDRAGCFNSDNKTVTINPLPDCTITAPLAVCDNSTGNIASVPDAGAGATYNWTMTNGTITGGSDNNSITWDAGSISPVTIGINILNSFGCSCSNPGINITVNPLPTATASGKSPVCVGDTIQLTGGSDNMTLYSWTGPNGFTSNKQSPSIPNAITTMSGNYFLTVTNTNGCTSNTAAVAISVVTCGGGGGGGAGDTGVGQTTGGVNCPLSLALNMEGNTTTTGISTTGVLCETCIARDAMGKYVLELGKNTQVILSGNTVPLLLRFRESSNPPLAPENTAIIGPVYEISAYPTSYITAPSPVTISPPAILTLPYDPKELPENMTEVYIADYDATQGWLALASVPGVVAELGKAQGLASHFSTFAVLAKLTKSEQAKFEVSNLIVSPFQVKPNKEVTISVKLTNIGGKGGDYSLQLKVDGILKSSKQVTVPAGTSQTINFTIKEGAIGKYHIDVAGQTGEFVVSRPSFKFNWWLIEGILFAIMLGLATWMLIKLRSV